MASAIELDAERQLLETLRKIEALAAGTTFDGERTAAEAARQRVLECLKEVRAENRDVEQKFTLNDEWSRRLLTALLRRYGIAPYRYSGQRWTTVMARLPDRFLDDVLWPQFLQISKVLDAHLAAVTDRIIAEGVCEDASDAEVRPQQAALSFAQDSC